MIQAQTNQQEVEYSAILDVPASAIDLAGWIRNFKPDEYRACTPATGNHFFMLGYLDGDGNNIYRNDERCGPVWMVQLYRESIMEPHHVFLVSPATRALVLGFWPMRTQVTWDLTAKPVEGDKTRFTCRIGYRMNPIYYVLARFFLAIGFFMEAHCEEETPHFANFAARFAMRNAPDRRESYLLPKNQVS